MISDAERKLLHKARDFWQEGEVDKAWDIVQKLLLDHPFDRDCLYMAGHIYEKAGNIPIAYHMFRQGTQVAPREASGWLNFGRTAEELWRTVEAERAYEKALKISKRQETTLHALGNLAALCVDNGRYPEAEMWAKKALGVDFEFRGARANLGFAQLGQRNWGEGWANYRASLGTDWRKIVQYRDEPEWDGSPDKTVVLYGEQGLGDEISFASMVPDAIRQCRRVILDVDARLANLFKRSFPGASVYGTRQAKARDGIKWAAADQQFDASLALGQIGEYFRTSPDSFPGTPYLVPDPERVSMWKSLWSQKNKPVIGIAWKGGIPKTGAKFRKWTLEQLLPVLSSVDAHWVSLEYRSAEAEIEEFRKNHPEIDIKEYPHATLASDYDNTAALVASLDQIFCIQTAVAHLGGALGIPTWVCVPKISQWRYGMSGDSVPWYHSVKVIRQLKGVWNLETIGAALADYRRVPEAERNAA